MGATTATGVITKQSSGSFIFKSDEGEELRVLTGRVTQFIPPTYRSALGDEVGVTYTTSPKSDDSFVLIAYQLESIKVNPDNTPPESPLTCTLKMNKNGWLYLHPEGAPKKSPGIVVKIRSDSTFTDGDTSTSYYDFRPVQPGQKMTVSFVQLPRTVGNGYYLKLINADMHKE